jgi:hypothetical protein
VTTIGYSEVRRLCMEDKVSSLAIKDNTLTMKLKENYGDTGSSIVTHQLYDIQIFYNDLAAT